MGTGYSEIFEKQTKTVQKILEKADLRFRKGI